MLTHPAYLSKLKPGLEKYRIIHHIDDEHHRLALDKCGWTPEEYELGIKTHHRHNNDAVGHEEEEDEYLEEEDDPLHDWKWRMSRFVARIFD